MAHLLAKNATMLPSVNKLNRLVGLPPYVMTTMLADIVGDFYAKTVSINVCRQLAKLGNLHAMHRLSSLCNDPMDQRTVIK